MSALGTHERAAVARLLETLARAADDPQATRPDRVQLLLGYIRGTVEAAAVAVRRGYRAEAIDQLTAQFDGFIRRLAEPRDPRGGDAS